MDTPGLSLIGRQKPAYIVGGDWFDYFQIKRKIVFNIGDASGKGISAALLSSVVISALAVELRLGLPLAEVANQVNAAVKARFRPKDFATVIIGEAAPDGSLIKYVNAGHEPPLHYQAATRRWSAIKSRPNLPLGQVEDLDLDEQHLYLAKGDKALLYSDGLYDVHGDSERLGLAGVLDWLHKHQELDGQELVSALLSFAVAFADGRIPDDITVVLVERIEP